MAGVWLLSDEPDFRILSVTGEDAESFLQGQFTQDIPHIPEDAACWTASCNYQGRVASTALIYRITGGFALLMRASIADDEVARLKKYVLRSKVVLTAEDRKIKCVYCTESKPAQNCCPALPVKKLGVYKDDHVTVIRISDEPCFVVIGELPHTFDNTEKHGGQLREFLMLEGVALIDKGEALQWMPQALNLDIIGAVSFSKGCYTGQEVIARTQHLGNKKRRMFLGTCCFSDIAEGEEIYAGSEAAAKVIQASGNKFLFVLQTDFANSELSLHSCSVKKLELPYEISF